MSRLHPIVGDGRILVPTGRGGSAFIDEVSLDELLRRYDRAFPVYTELTRQEVIDAYRQAEALTT